MLRQNRVGQEQVVQPTAQVDTSWSTWNKWYKEKRVFRSTWIKRNKEEGVFRSSWNKWNKDKGSVQLNLSTCSKVGLQGREKLLVMKPCCKKRAFGPTGSGLDLRDRHIKR